MSQDLIQADQFALITFSSTSHALKAEKILKAREAEFLLIPTLREISSSCGLSVKFRRDRLPDFYHELKSHQINMEGIYWVDKVQGKFLVKKVDEKGL